MITIHLGDAVDKLKEMDDASIDCVVTSPPYWGLRDYGVDGQLGLEKTLEDHLNIMVGQVFAEIHRVLKDEGTCWVNYGDCYATTPNGTKAKDIEGDDRAFRDKPFSTIGGVLKVKDLCMMPNRFAIAMQEFGWWVRSEIIWHKPNPMPESAKDRPHTSHEKIFLFTKSEKYYYNADAVRQEISPKTLTTINCERKVRDGQEGTKAANMAGSVIKMPDGWDTGAGAHGKINKNGRNKGKRKRVHVKQSDDRCVPPRNKGNINHKSLVDVPTGGANLKNVWSVAPKPFREAHFATFPPEIPELCIAAGCPKDGTVLDPFGGAGTTALVAGRFGIDCVLIELNPEYIEIARKRLEQDYGMFGETIIL